MPSTDPRIDAYIEGRPAFARPILQHLRAAVHRACPEVEETLRWSMPSFTYKGRILCQMAAFKEHASFGFWRGKEVAGEGRSADGMGQLGKLRSLSDLPTDYELDALIRKAAALIESGVKAPRAVKQPRAEIVMPSDLAAALAANPAAQATYDAFPPGCRREYLEWVVEAKRPETRAKRVSQAVEWMAEGKRRNWKYEKC
ncbi:hypothetical protein HJG53_08140 [Sphingomonas sp. ID1715]|uniref:YdeI/OmpD-associated family protein n=1 Tax=Sphingomonas sp. ID1715 TaxID=1656898 RepID=UPI001488F4F7|nr:YdeI/OmpD-associated family protein [Sphingomonas sp. ID1715]NNM76866.1 hypothetical protein [Sphingomonas sp. ID1715]